ncbi:MAG: cupin domain-containing protein [Phycisphaerales bacterium]
MDKVNLADAFAQIPEPWRPRLEGEVNECAVKLVKLRGEFIWHAHEREDEMFLVVRGAFTMRLRDRDIELSAGEFLIVPRGVEHLPVASDEAWVLLFEPMATLNTGNVRSERTVERPERL